MSSSETSQKLFAALRAGDDATARDIVKSRVGTGHTPPRLALLKATDQAGKRPEDVAAEVGLNALAEFFRRERVRMELFE